MKSLSAKLLCHAEGETRSVQHNQKAALCPGPGAASAPVKQAFITSERSPGQLIQLYLSNALVGRSKGIEVEELQVQVSLTLLICVSPLIEAESSDSQSLNFHSKM